MRQFDQINQGTGQMRVVKRKKKRKFPKVLFLMIVFVLVFVFYEQGMNLNFDWLPDFKFDFKFEMPEIFKGGKKGSSKRESYDSQLVGKVVAYVPIDDRAIHTTRMSYLAESYGIKLKTPEKKYYKTYIGSGDNSYAGYSTKYGNPVKILSWLKEQEEAGCDYYILSLDQLFSGGVVGSSYLSDTDFEVYGKNSISNIRKYLETLMKDKNNHVYLIDSVVGLSVMPEFMDFTLEDYQMLVAFSSFPRKVFNGEELTIENISENYLMDVNDSTIYTDLDLEKLNRYLSARERKLALSKSILEMIHNSDNSNVHIYYGIEDSGGEGANIQTNDIAYIRSLAAKNELYVPIREKSSTLVEVAFADMLLDSITKDVSVKVTYYGDPNQMITSSMESYGSFMSSFMNDLSINLVEEDPDFEVLVYTRTVPEMREANANQLLNHYLHNIKEHIPTVIINDADYREDLFLINNLSDYELTQVPMGYLIGYSNWNEYIHSCRIAFSEGITRFLFLASERDDEDCDKGYIKVMTESFVEDMSYLPSAKDSLDVVLVEKNTEVVRKRIISNLQTGNYITGIHKYSEGGIRSVGTYNYNFSWNRVDDLDFDVSATLTDAHSITIPDVVTYQNKEA